MTLIIAMCLHIKTEMIKKLSDYLDVTKKLLKKKVWLDKKIIAISKATAIPPLLQIYLTISCTSSTPLLPHNLIPKMIMK